MNNKIILHVLNEREHINIKYIKIYMCIQLFYPFPSPKVDIKFEGKQSVCVLYNNYKQ